MITRQEKDTDKPLRVMYIHGFGSRFPPTATNAPRWPRISISSAKVMTTPCRSGRLKLGSLCGWADGSLTCSSAHLLAGSGLHGSAFAAGGPSSR